MTGFVMSGEPPKPDSRDYNLSLLGLLVVWMSHWRLLVALAVIAAVVALGVSFLVHPQYQARGKFVPESRATAGLGGNVSGLASQLGVSLSGGEPTQSPQFYADLVKTRPVLTAIVLHRYALDSIVGNDRSDQSLLDWLTSPDRNEARRLETGLRKLGVRTTVGVDRRTNVVTIEVEMPSPSLAAAVVAQYLSYLNEFNLRYRQSQAHARREFSERQVQEAEKSLTLFEDSLRHFYERNRQWQSSPMLQFEENRLRRRVDGQQEVFISLRRELESARIAEVNDTPVLTVIEPPVAPAHKSSPRRLQWAWLAFVLTTVGVLVGLVLYGNRFHWRAVDPTAYEWLSRRLTPSRHRKQ